MAEDFELRNISEELVDMHLNDCIRNSPVCRCDRCRADIRAFALNNFPPHYVVTDFGEAMTKTMSLSVQFQADILTAIMRGVKLVSEKPRHPIEDSIFE